METETRERELWRELIEEAEAACENKDQVIGWLAAKLATELIEKEKMRNARKSLRVVPR